MNRLQLIASVLECQPLRYTPAGVPVLEMQLEHGGTVTEAGHDRQVELTITAIALGDLARMLASTPMGTTLRVEGFLAPTRKGSSRLRLHLQQAAAHH
ncbi:primosomal replication protein N [Verticiella sediminum]|uniref:Replication restart protein PriB n=1 Tax=Verticiella sediminum TaxID=1247510 RepID=A0A556ABL8_9BURK|nr:primosomal replication protein N [Verticiella sediminum]TSH90257.1 primosomal replication protein N [Verticiella sediminum]